MSWVKKQVAVGVRAGSANTASVTLSGVTAGSLIPIVVGLSPAGTQATALSVIDSSGNAITSGVAPVLATAFPTMAVYYVKGAANGNHQITVTLGASDNANITLIVGPEWAGGNAVDVASALSAVSSGATVSAPSITTTTAGDLVIFAATQSGTADVFSAFNNSLTAELTESGGPCSVIADVVQASAGAIACECTTSVSGNQWVAAAIAFLASSAAVTVSSVNSGAVITEGATGVPFTGTGFASGMTANIVQSINGTAGSVVAQASVVYVDATDGTFALTMEPAGDQLAFTDSVYSDSLQVTVGANSGSGAIAGLAPPAGLIFSTLTSINATSAYRITATPDLAVNDQLEAAGNSAGTSAAPAGLTLNADGTFTFAESYPPTSFWVRAYDSVGFSWGAWAEQTVVSSATVPDLSGMTAFAGEAALVAAGFSYWTLSYEISYTVPLGEIVSTLPVAGSIVSPTTDIIIYVSSGPQPPNPGEGSGSPISQPIPMASATLPSYLYKQYQDDDDLQAFVAAYNAGTQTYVDWFNSVNLPFYPALTGPLLDWVATGLYGLPRTTLARTISGAVGPLNTEELNTAQLNAFTPPVTTYYDLSDDIFKRILTWNYYKGDGKRFSVLWLKRKIMRFLLGANGLDPDPNSPDFVIGPENTQAIGVQVASGVLTVSINQPYLSSLVQLVPGILNIFIAAFTGGVLDLPLQYTYATSIITSLTATVNPNSESATGITTTLSTGSADVSVYGGSGSYTYAWTWQSGGTGITINSASASSTSFTATGMTRGTTLTGTALCTVTDTVSLATTTTTVSVSIKNVSAPSLTLAPSSISTTISTSSYTSASIVPTVTGGAGPYTYGWTWSVGGTGITITSPTGAQTTVSIASLSSGSTDSGTLLCTVTDSYGQTATATCTVSVTRATGVSASVSPTSLTVSSSTLPETTGSATVTASGGQAPYTYAWTLTWVSHTDSASYAINSPHSAATTFTVSGMTAGNTDTATGKCLVTDSLGQTATVDVSLSFTYLPPLQSSYTSGSGTITVPAGYNTMTLEAWGGGAGGEAGTATVEGVGGAAAGYSRSAYSVTGGQTVDYTVGVGGNAGIVGGSAATAGTASTVSSGSLSITTMTANGGSAGGSPGGTATGGNQANTAGGTTSTISGGVAANGVYANNPAAEGDGGNGGLSGADTGGSPKNGNAGRSGLISVRFS